MKTKRPNPAYAEGIDTKAWILAAKTLRMEPKIYHDEAMRVAAKEDSSPLFTRHVEEYRRELSNTRFYASAMRQRRILDRIPKRTSLKEVPFYLRPHYVKAKWDGSNDTVYLPDKDYPSLVKAPKVYQPITGMEAALFAKRHKIMQRNMVDLIRWPETLDSTRCSYVITKNFDDFYFKVTTAEEGNKLPHIKRSSDIFITARGPREFFNQEFWGLGSHLVVKVLEATIEDDVSVLKTFSCDREDLYVLDQPNILKIRYYVKKGSQRGTGLTKEAALKSMHYYMGKELVRALGA